MSMPAENRSLFDIFQKKPSKVNFDFFLSKGNDLWANRNFKKALKYFNLAIQSDPDDARPWNNKGIVYRNLGQVGEAKKAFKNALELSPGNKTIQNNLESLNKPIASGTPSQGFGISDRARNLFPMLKYEIPRVMGTALVIVSGILFLILFLLFKSSESFWNDNFQYLALALTAVSFAIILMAVISQFYYLAKLVLYEMKYFLIYLAGAMIVMTVPIHESLEVGASGELFSTGNAGMLVIGCIFMALGFYYFYIKGAYFLPWLLGVIIFLVVSFHETARLVVFTGTFGVWDQTTAVFGIILTFVGLFLFLYRRAVNMLLNKSEELRRDGKHDDAMRYQDLILKLNPKNEVAWNDKGNVLYTIGDMEGALKCYNKALSIDGSYDIARHNLDLLEQSPTA